MSIVSKCSMAIVLAGLGSAATAQMEGRVSADSLAVRAASAAQASPISVLDYLNSDLAGNNGGVVVRNSEDGEFEPTVPQSAVLGPQLFWHNGLVDTNGGLASQFIAANPEFPHVGFGNFVADDFLLKAGKRTYLEHVQAYFWVNGDILVDGIGDTSRFALNIYADCNGRPGAVVDGNLPAVNVEVIPDADVVTGTPSTGQVQVTDDEGRLAELLAEFDLVRVTFKVDRYFQDLDPCGPRSGNDTTGPNDDGCEFGFTGLLETYERYWVSPYGIGTGISTFWASSNNLVVQGVQGQLAVSAATPVIADAQVQPWEDSIRCPCATVCTDFAFKLFGCVGHLNKDNTPYDENDVPPGDSITFPNMQLEGARSADNFQIAGKPGVDPDQWFCEIRAFVASNCTDFFAEIYENECETPIKTDYLNTPSDLTDDLPLFTLGSPNEINLIVTQANPAPPGFTGTTPDNDYSCHGATYDVNNPLNPADELRIYELVWYDPIPLEMDADGNRLSPGYDSTVDPQPRLAPGENYWLSIVGVGSGSIFDRSVWLFRENCGDTFNNENFCRHINITEGQYKNQFENILDFTQISELFNDEEDSTGTTYDPNDDFGARDFAFLTFTYKVDGTITRKPRSAEAPYDGMSGGSDASETAGGVMGGLMGARR